MDFARIRRQAMLDLHEYCGVAIAKIAKDHDLSEMRVAALIRRAKAERPQLQRETDEWLANAAERQLKMLGKA